VLIGAAIVLTEWENISPTYAVPGQPEVPMIKLVFKTNTGTAILNRLLLDLAQGTPSDVEKVGVYRDDNGNGKFDGSSIDMPLMMDVTPTQQCTLSGNIDVTMTPSTYFIAFDVAQAVPIWTVIELKAVDRSYLSTTSVTHGISPYNFPFEAGVIIYYGIILKDSLIAPLCVVPGEKDVPMFKLLLKTEVGTAEWESVRFKKIGNAPSDDYIEKVKLYEDTDTDGEFDPSSDLVLGSAGVVNGISDIGFSVQNLTTDFKSYFVVIDIGQDVEAGRTVGLRCPSYHFFETSPTIIYADSFPFEGLCEIGTEVSTGDSSIAPTLVDTGANDVGMTMIELYTESGEVGWEGLWLLFTGDNASDVEEVKLYRDNGDTSFNPSLETLIASGDFVDDTVKLSFSGETIDTIHKFYFIAFDISGNAQAGNIVGLICEYEKYFIFSGDNCLKVNFSPFIDTTEVEDPSYVEEKELKIPTSYILDVIPNPTRCGIDIHFGLPKDEKVNIEIYNVSGQKVREVVKDKFNAGYHRINIKEDLGMGIYFVVLKVGNTKKVEKVIRIKK
jgi:hypothetical protein